MLDSCRSFYALRRARSPMLRRIGFFASALLFLGAHAAAEPKAAVLITGSSTVAPLMVEVAKAFEKAHQGARVDVQTGGSARGVSDCRAGLNQIGMISRDPKPDETDFRAVRIARDGLAFIASPDAGVSGLTHDQILSVYRGTVTNWRELGGKDLRIAVVSKAEGRAALELFMAKFGIKSSEIKAQAIVGDEEQAIKTVTATRGSIAYLSVSTVAQAVGRGAKIVPLSYNGNSPTIAAVRSGVYPLTRFLHLIDCGKGTAASKAFLDFVVAEAGQRFIEENQYIPL